MRLNAAWAAAFLAAALVVSGCDTAPRGVCVSSDASCVTPCDARGIRSISAAPVAPVAQADAPTVDIAFMLATTWTDRRVSPAQVGAWIEEPLANTREVFAQCGVQVRVVRAEAVAVPAARLTIRANAPDSWAGLAPEGVDSEQYNYDLNERVTDDVRTMFAYARRGLPERVLTVVVLDRIEFFADHDSSVAGGISFPPNLYHSVEDFPVRNGVFVASAYPHCGALPVRLSKRIVAHELGHMLLNVAHHEEDPKNLMHLLQGPELSETQCEEIRAHLGTIYGSTPFADPGRPRER